VVSQQVPMSLGGDGPTPAHLVKRYVALADTDLAHRHAAASPADRLLASTGSRAERG
jgi:hypothetical protein